MGSITGQNLVISIFGESHGPAIGVTINGLLPGFYIEFNKIKSDLRRRSLAEGSTERVELDDFKVISGVFKNATTGTPLTAIFYNRNAKSEDYNENFPRPSHADLITNFKYKGFNDFRGGGHFSGRLTAPLVFAGSIAKQMLFEKFKTKISARHNLKKAEILKAKKDGDSIGGLIICVCENVPRGCGEPIFKGVESVVSALLFSIPGVKAVEFGDGFEFNKKLGSQTADEIKFVNIDGIKKNKYLSNHNGGINGGITNGDPIVITVGIKPTPTIKKPLKTVNLKTKENVEHVFEGRHDASIVARAVVVVEAAVAIGLLDLAAMFVL